MTRNEAIDTLKANYPDAHYSELREAVDLAIKVLEEPERKKGKWLQDEFGIYCSCCGYYAYRDKFGRPWESNFCPNCGADMRDEEKRGNAKKD